MRKIWHMMSITPYLQIIEKEGGMSREEAEEYLDRHAAAKTLPA